MYNLRIITSFMFILLFIVSPLAFAESSGTDLSGDNIVYLEDLTILCSQWLDTCGSRDEYCDGSDINRDRIVNFQDFLMLAEDWLSLVSTPADVIAYYTFDNNAYDSTANQYDGTIANLSYSAEVPLVIEDGNSLNWPEGSSGYVDLPVVRGLGQNFTVTMWVKVPSDFNDTSNACCLISNQETTDSGFSVYLNFLTDDDCQVVFDTNNGNETKICASGTYNLTKGLWHHLAVVRRDKYCSFYINGMNAGYSQSNFEILSDFKIDNTIRIGANFQAGNSSNWIGCIDDVAIWDGVLDASLIFNLAAGSDSPASHMVAQARCVAYYNFDADANDISGLNYNGTVSNLNYSADVPSVIGSGHSLNWIDSTNEQYVAIPSINELEDQFAVTMWVKIPSDYNNTEGYQPLLTNQVPWTSGFSIVVNTWGDDDGRLKMETDNADGSLDASTPEDVISKGIWHHIAIVRDVNLCKFYVDGIDAGYYNENWAEVLADFNLDSPLRIGANFQLSANCQCWVGNIDDVAVWKGVLSENVIQNLYNGADSPANHIVPQWWSSEFIDVMQPFYRYQTMVDCWLESGGGIRAVPDWWTTAGDFPYQKRPYSTEGHFTDEFILVRSLGGWPSSWSVSDEDDVACRDGNGVMQYNWTLLNNRIDPYIDSGYDSLTFVFDNVCWDFPTYPLNGTYGQKVPPADMDEWYDFVQATCNYLATTYGEDKVENWQFRVGTELHDAPRFSGTIEQLNSFYDHTSEAVLDVFSGANVGPYNFFSFDSEHIALLNHIKSGTNYVTGLTGSVNNFTSRSLYMTRSGFRNPRAAAATYKSECDSVDSIMGYSVPREVHEFGVLTNEWGTSTDEPGAYGAAWTFSIMMNLYSGGVTKLQHWQTYEAGATNFLRGRYWPYMVLDYMLGGDIYKVSSPSNSANGTQYEIFVVDKGSKKYILVSAFNSSRNTVDSQSVTFSVPRKMLSISENSVIKETALTTSTSVQDAIKADFATNGLLLSPWSSQSGAIGSIYDMGGTDGINYVNSHLSIYQAIFTDSLTLSDFTGNYSKTSSNHEFTVVIENPTVMVIAIID